MSDTHDNLALVDKAINLFNREKVDLVLHAGDYVAPFTVERFKRLRAKLIGVFGNNDGDHELLKRKFAELEAAEIRGSFAEIVVDGVKIALLHGEEHELLQSLIRSRCFDFVVSGHSHQAKKVGSGNTVAVNPGEVCGYLSGESTIALLDLESCETKILRLL